MKNKKKEKFNGFYYKEDKIKFYSVLVIFCIFMFGVPIAWHSTDMFHQDININALIWFIDLLICTECLYVFIICSEKSCRGKFEVWSNKLPAMFASIIMGGLTLLIMYPVVEFFKWINLSETRDWFVANGNSILLFIGGVALCIGLVYIWYLANRAYAIHELGKNRVVGENKNEKK